MDAPKCQKIPSCGKRHYGDCGTTQTPRKARPVRDQHDACKPEKKSTGFVVDARDPAFSLEERVAVLEKIVGELCGFRKKRSEYMKKYMADKRAEEKGDG